MKKTLLLLALMPAMAMAQTELPNGSFEGTWGDCTPWNSDGNTTTLGTQPADWTIANVMGVKMFFGTLGSTTVGEQVEGVDGEKAVKLTNLPNSVMNSQIVPGYITLGTSWNTSVMGQSNDGGSFGGINFTGRPDALSFQYKRSHGTESDVTKGYEYTVKAEEPFSVVAYTWTGSTLQTNVPATIGTSGTPTTTDMKNRDRNILGIKTSLGDLDIQKTADFKLVASIIDTTETADAADWTKKTVEFTYTDKKLTPAMLNVVFSAGSYFNPVVGAKNTLTVDDVKLVYYSRLSTITLGGEEIEGFDPNVFDYTITLPIGSDPDDALFDLECKALGYAATKSENGDADDYKIKVTNPDGADADGLSEHTYHLHFLVKPTPAGEKIDGQLTVEMMGQTLMDHEAKSVYISDEADGTKTFTLPDFSIAIGGSPVPLGDIVVPNMTTTTDDEGIHYTGAVKGMELGGGEIVADVNVTGLYQHAGAFRFDISVTWQEIPITVTFEGTGTATSLQSLEAATARTIYDLQGRQRTTLAKGVNIVNGRKVIK